MMKVKCQILAPGIALALVVRKGVSGRLSDS